MVSCAFEQLLLSHVPVHKGLSTPLPVDRSLRWQRTRVHRAATNICRLAARSSVGMWVMRAHD
eukprot:1422733-Amphidinium_carterae.1